MKTLKIAGAVVGGLAAVALVVGFFLPTHWRVQRAIVVDAPRAVIHRCVNDLRQWHRWGGWSHDADPTVELSYAGPATGAGAIHRWHGDRAGAGDIQITRSDPQRGVWIKQTRRNERRSRGSLQYESVAAGGTRVTWQDEGDIGHKPIGGYVVRVVEQALGHHFEIALTKLKQITEAEAAASPNAPGGAKPHERSQR